ncbi:hypothetical protein P691DRAFT_109548 [Macrolepiota fuliginosa MF-IS2]|uniref:C2H2-type domain-containing protein n=1 Tax=Macrolepiota fuliginosa MF-IS2 TaxID=1400762 RepID=A0A9P6C3A7_9AGAR|nr:hypothetical protein P691DRAFT_109548 [Macrolepiota fuliginosa MF-IS2]
MARADDQSSNSKMHTQAEVATSRRRTAGKSEAYVAPLWPCKINGCGKKFVREADLKRHQRTTKTHSMPSFTCQECDASFTRTDALRRHQKSRHHVVRALSRSTNAFIEESGTTSGETKAPSTSSSRSTRSRSSRSLSPRLSQERAKERSERERRERELPPLETTGPSRYYRQHTATSSPYPPPATPPQSAPVSRPQTHSSSLNAILASPISTPRLHPVNWSYPSPSGQRTTHDGYTAPPPPQPPPSVQSNGHYAPHYRYPAAPDMVPPILGPIHPPLSHRPANLDLKHTRRQNPYPTISTSSTSPSTRETSETSFIPTPSPPPPPPIASTGPVPLSASSYDSDDSESEAEVDELLPSSPEPETETDSSHRIPDIEACIDPATGITAEEVKAAMDAVLKSVQQQELEKEEQQQQQVDGECVVDAHGRARDGIFDARRQQQRSCPSSWSQCPYSTWDWESWTCSSSGCAPRLGERHARGLSLSISFGGSQSPPW